MNKIETVEFIVKEVFADDEESLWAGCCELFNEERKSSLALEAFKAMMAKFGYQPVYLEEYDGWFFRGVA